MTSHLRARRALSSILVLGLAVTSPVTAAPRIDPAALASLCAEAAATESDAVVIYQDGKLVADWTFGKPPGPIEAMSVTKSIASLAIARLLDTGALRSLDLPLGELFPEWRQGRKQTITLRHLLSHTSGLQNDPDAGREIYPSPDWIKLALAAELTSEPGAVFAYNNKAVNLLAAVVQAVSGKPLDRYLRDEIFEPMGITDVTWSTDRAGTPQVMAGLQIRARDLAKLGVMMLDGGMWNGKRILGAARIAELTRPSQALFPSYGLLWWLVQDFRKVIADDGVIATWRAAGVGEDFIAKLRPLKDRIFTDRDAYLAAIAQALGDPAIWDTTTWRAGLPAGRYLPTPVQGFYADGYLGQWLVVIPASRIVAVRQRRHPGEPAKVADDRLGFDAFRRRVLELARGRPVGQGQPARRAASPCD